MKKYSTMVILGALVVLLSACGGGQPPAAPAAPAAPEAPAASDAAPAAAEAGSQLDFTLVNATGYDIKELYLSPSASNNWEENMIPADQIFANGSSAPIRFTGYRADVQLWDLKAIESDDPENPHIYSDIDLTQITKLTLNAEDATAEKVQ